MDERIKELAEQAGLSTFWLYVEQLDKFAEFIRDDERKACAEYYLSIMRDAVEQAVLREREACFAIVETHPTVREMSIAIRARTNDD